MSESKWTEAGYYKDFKCKCGDCRHPCCNGWNINVTRDEYYRLLGIECSNELRKRIDVSFLKRHDATPETYAYIAPNYVGSCHMLDDDGLCMLQKECGEAAIPEICRVYPRNMKNVKGINVSCCTASCEKVVELLMTETPLELVDMIDDLKVEFSDEREDIDFDLLEKSFLIISDKSQRLSDKIERLCTEVLNVKKCDTFFDIHESIYELLNACDRLSSESFELFDFVSEIKSNLESGKIHISEILEDREVFERKYPDWEIWFENIILNNFIYSNFPFTDDRINYTESAKGLCFMYALMRLFAIELTKNDYSIEKFVDVISGLFHLVEHTAFYYNSHVLLNSEYLHLLKL